MVIVPKNVELGHFNGVAVGVLAKELGLSRGQIRGWYRMLDYRSMRAAEGVQQAKARDRRDALRELGVRQALEDGDPAGAAADYPLDGLRRWGLSGVPSCFGVSRGD